ncbi:MAG: S8 family peptidase [Oligoflexia bacterium]|nr:S8 family peptidase [Oligoflexia bacterium]
MRLKAFHLYILIVIVFSLGFFSLFIFKNSASIRNNSSVTEKNREPILGQAQFAKEKNTDFSKLEQYIEKQWALKDILIKDTWEEVLKEKKDRPPLVVAVIDTGIYPKHPCLKNQLWTNKKEIPNNGVDDDKNGFIDDIHGWNFVENNNKIQDYHGHGTHVSGIIAAQGPPHCEIIGVAPHVQLMVLKYFEEGADNSNNIINTIKSIEYAVNNGANIINYSGGGPGSNQDEKSAIAQAADKGIIFVAALGNEGSKIGEKIQYYPASYKLPNIVFVQSHNEREERVESSNYTEKTFLQPRQVQTAPGENIISTLPPKLYLQGKIKSAVFRNLAFSPKKNYYGYMTGTSQATAVATGVVALAKTQQPTWTMEKIIQQITQGNKLSAYGAVTMRPQNVDLSDQIDHTNTVVPHDPSKIVDIFKNPKRLNDDSQLSQKDTFEQIKNLESLVNQKSKRKKDF